MKRSAKDRARSILRRPWIGKTAQASVEALGQASRRLSPTVDALYRKLPTSDGLAMGVSPDEQEVALRAYYTELTARLEQCAEQPTISILVPTYRPDHRFFAEMLASIGLQIYPHWQLCIVDDASDDPVVTEMIAEFSELFPGQVSTLTREENGHIVAASNDAMTLATGEYCALVDHDDRLYPHALAEVVLALNTVTPRPLVLYTDERMIDESGRLLGDAWLKPDWMPLLHLTSNYTNHLTVYATDLLRSLGGFRSGFDGSQDHDLMLRATEATDDAGIPVHHIPSITYQWRSHPGSVAGDPAVKSYSIAPAIRAVTEACQRRGYPARVWREEGIVANRIDVDLSTPAPRVAIASPRPLHRSLIASDPVYGPGDRVEFHHLAGPVNAGDSPVNLAAQLNEVLANSEADYLMVLDADVTPQRADWLSAMVRIGQVPQVGAVGGLILDTDGRVKHAGYVGQGASGIASAMAGMPPTEDVYLAWPASIHEVLGVSRRAMLLDRREAVNIGGFDEDFGWHYTDIDLCLRLKNAGLRSVFTPYAVFTHTEPTNYETSARPITQYEDRLLRQRWGRELSNDPYLNPGLGGSAQFRIDPTLMLPEIPVALFDRWLGAVVSGTHPLRESPDAE